MDKPPPRPFPGGPLALDLLNTVWRQSGHPVDWLCSDAAVAEFAASRSSVLSIGDLGPARSALLQARALIQRLFEAAAAGAIPPKLEAEIDAALTRARVGFKVGPEGAGIFITGEDPANRLAIEALVNAIELLRDWRDRVRSCEHEDCTIWFLDTSKAGRRRWCSMEVCGNRAKARRHYARTAHASKAASDEV